MIENQFFRMPNYGQTQEFMGGDMPGLAGPLMSPSMLDGTNFRGANSMPGGFDVGSLGMNQLSNVGGGGASGGGGFWQSMVGGPGQQGWGGLAVGAASALANGFMGMKQFGLAKASLAQNKQQFETNFNAQKNLTNSKLEDRQRARVSSNESGYQSVGDYMNKNKVA